MFTVMVSKLGTKLMARTANLDNVYNMRPKPSISREHMHKSRYYVRNGQNSSNNVSTSRFYCLRRVNIGYQEEVSLFLQAPGNPACGLSLDTSRIVLAP